MRPYKLMVPALAVLAVALPAAAEIPEPQGVPWGAPAKMVDEGSSEVGINSRVTLKNQPGNPAPVLAIGKEAVVLYEVENVSAEPLAVWHAGFWPNHRVLLFRPGGEEAPLTPYGEKVRAAYSPRGKRGKNARWSLAPGKVDITEGGYDLTELFDMSLPGVYRLQIEYEEEFAMASNVLPIRVVDKGAAKP